VVTAQRAQSLDVLVAGFAAGRGGDVIEGALGVDRVVEDDGVDDQVERAELLFLAFAGLAELAAAAAADVAGEAMAAFAAVELDQDGVPTTSVRNPTLSVSRRCGRNPSTASRPDHSANCAQSVPRPPSPRALEQVRQAELERQAAEQDAQLARKEAERAEKLAEAAERRAEQADERAQAAVERAEQQARAERAELERQLGEQRDARQAAEFEHGRAQAAHEAEQRLRAQLEKDLATTQWRLEAAEKARDTAIKTLGQAATRAATTRKPQR
jgi:hypothetical protein